MRYGKAFEFDEDGMIIKKQKSGNGRECYGEHFKDGKLYYLGMFTTASEARLAYVIKAMELFGEYASSQIKLEYKLYKEWGCNYTI
jgi:hypothetical protein